MMEHHLDALRIAVASRNWVLVDLVIAGIESESQNRVEPRRSRYPGHQCNGARCDGDSPSCNYYEPCCDQAYVCPQSNDTECLVHGGFDNCCAHPDCPGNVQGLKVLTKAFWDTFTTPQTESLTESQVAEELGVTLPPTTNWDSYDECEYCEAPTGSPCKYMVGSPHHGEPGTRRTPHTSRNLIRQNKDQESEVVEAGTHQSPPVPTTPHSTPHCTVPDCDLCEKDKELDHPADCKCVNPECLMKWMDGATVKELDDVVKEPDLYLCCKHCRHDFPRLGPVHLKPCNHVGCLALKPVEKPKLCIRYNACKYPDHSAVADCIMEEKQVTYPHCEHCPRATKMGINYGECLFTEHVAPCVHCQEGK